MGGGGTEPHNYLMGAIPTLTGTGYLIPLQSGNSGKFLTTDGSVLSWGTPSGGGGGGTVTSVGLSSATSGVTIGGTPITTSGTLTIAIATASGSSNGLLSSTDWTTFNNKQNTITNPVTGTGTTNYLSKWTSGSALGNSLVFDNGTNVGIGTATPNTRLNVVSSGVGVFAARFTDGVRADLVVSFPASQYAGLDSYFGSGDGGFIFRNGTTEAVRIMPGGNLIVNYASDNGAKFQVNGGIYGKGITSDSDGGVGNAIYAHNQVLTGSSNNALLQLDTTWNTTGNPSAIELNVTNTASGSASKVMNLKVDLTSVFTVSKGGAIQTAEPTGYTAKPWKLGDATSGTITPDYYIKVEIDGQIYSIPALLGTP